MGELLKGCVRVGTEEVWVCRVADEREGKEGTYDGYSKLEGCLEVGDGLVVLVVVVVVVFIALIAVVVVFDVFVFEGGSYVVVVFFF